MLRYMIGSGLVLGFLTGIVWAVDPDHAIVSFRGLRILAESDDTSWETQEGNERYLRFAGSSSQFIASGHDLTGVGRVTTGGLRDNGTMITASFCLGAHHSCRHPEPGELLELFVDKDTSTTYEVDTTAELGELGNSSNLSCSDDGATGSDLEICKLENQIGSQFAVYPIYSKSELDSGDQRLLYFGKPRQGNFVDFRVAYRVTEPGNWTAYFRPFRRVFDRFQLQNNKYSSAGFPSGIQVLSPTSTTAPHTYPLVEDDLSHGFGFRLDAGHAYVLSAVPTGSGSLALFWMNSSGGPISADYHVYSGAFEYRADAPSGAEGLYVQFTGSANVDKVSLRDVTLRSDHTPGPDECDPYSGDSGSPSLVYIAESADVVSPNHSGQQSRPSWGLMLAGTHRSWQIDNSITNTTEAAALTTQMLDMQSGAIHLKEVPVFWSGIYGDFNGDGSLTAADIDIITRKVENRSNNGYNWYLDWDGDGDHDTDDVISYVEDVHTFHTKVGDTDLDGDVDINDLIECGTFNSDNHWAIGDLNGDGITDVDDFNLAAANYPWTRP